MGGHQNLASGECGLRMDRMVLEAVLFDADGVIQSRPPGWKDGLGEVLGFRGDPGQFLADVFAAEVPSLDGQSDFAGALSNVLSRWSCCATLDDALRAWTMIAVDPGIADMIRGLRRDGVRCYLATNQEPYKAGYMSDVLAYRHLFDKEFYSCRVGLMKPSSAYFHAILREIGLSPSQALFVDDLDVNVHAAREVGLRAATFRL